MIGLGYEVTDDLFGISGRLKAIDPDYFVFYSYVKRRYEVHARGQRGGTLALVVPFDRLDERTVRLVLRTRRERADAYLAEIERENECLKKAERERAVRHAAVEAERILR